MLRLLSLSLLLFFAMINRVEAQKRSKETLSPELKQMRTIISEIEGSYFNTRFAAEHCNNPLLQEQQLRIFGLWEKREQGAWFYIGWFNPNIPRRPLAERIANLVPAGPDSFLVYFYQIPCELELQTQWEEAQPYAQLTTDRLKMDCLGTLVQRGKQQYELLPQKRPCRSVSRENFHFAYYQMKFSPRKLILFNSFYDKNFKLLFSYPQGNHFDLVSKKRSNF